jgi:hypothetical protein
VHHASPFGRSGPRREGGRAPMGSNPREKEARGSLRAMMIYWTTPAAASASECDWNHWKRTAMPFLTVQT